LTDDPLPAGSGTGSTIPERAPDPAPPADRPMPLAPPFSICPPSWTDLFDPRQPEAFLAFCSAWCACQMWIWPTAFDATNGVLTRQIGLYGHERTWATVGFLAALLKLGGLAIRLLPHWTGFAPGLRGAGLFLSIVFWSIVGISTMTDLPHSLLPVALIGLAMGAAFELAECREPRETWR
jgi:hypothetical protein